MVREEYFFARFFGDQQQRLDALGLVNRGFCPICGMGPIGSEHARKSPLSGVSEYICVDCENRTNPLKQPYHQTVLRRRWGCGIALVLLGFLVLRMCR